MLLIACARRKRQAISVADKVRLRLRSYHVRGTDWLRSRLNAMWAAPGVESGRYRHWHGERAGILLAACGRADAVALTENGDVASHVREDSFPLPCCRSLAIWFSTAVTLVLALARLVTLLPA